MKYAGQYLNNIRLFRTAPSFFFNHCPEIVYAYTHLQGKLLMLPRDIRKLVNQRLHQLGITYASQTKQQLLNELESMRAKGVTLEDLEKYIRNRPPPIFGALITKYREMPSFS